MKNWTTARWKKELWTHFSKFIRTRDKGICFTCGKQSEGSGYHAGHYIAQASCGLEARYNEDFTNGQCYNCNINQSGNHVPYRANLIKKFGEAHVIAFENTYHRPCKWQPSDFQSKIEEYKAKLQAL